MALFAIGTIYAVFFIPDEISGDLDLVRSDQAGVRVLFIGNAIVQRNAMIETLRELADGDPGGPRMFAVHYARRGSNLERALDDERVESLLDDERWDVVVLQEHSVRMARAQERAEHFLPAATKLAAMARRTGARVVLFGQGGYEEGDRDEVDDDTEAAMRERIRAGYEEAEATLGATTAPVGDAWGMVLRQQRGISLWARDGIRPNKIGSYLIATVFYTVITGRDPTRSRYADDIDAEQARYLREVARYVVGRARQSG